MAEKTVNITINGKTLAARANETVLQAMLRHGTMVPHFCYHPKLSIAGVCRMCLVEVEGSRKLEISCSLPVREGMVVHTESPKVLEGRQYVMEFTLINHPLDCPICDQAGECWLQEYYMDHDRKESQFKEEKVHKDKAKQIGPRIVLDQERCILCTRCVRFTQEITETSELGIFNRGDQSILDVAPGQVLDNAYSENVVDICPVGALTSKDFRFDGRVWFLNETTSVCPGCARGCNVVLQHRDGRIRRILPRVNEEVNGHFMCDAGRDVYKWVHHESRLQKPMMKSTPCTWSQAMESAAVALKKIQEQGAKQLLGMASVRMSNEDNFLFCKFLEAVFGKCGVSCEDLTPRTWEADEILRVSDCNPNTKGARAIVDAEIKRGNLHFVEAKNLLKLLEDEKIKSLMILDQDLLQMDDAKLRKSVEARLRKLDLLIVFSTHRSPTTDLAHLAFPITTFAEQEGSFINVQGHLQDFKEAISPVGESLPARRVLEGLARKLNVSLSIQDLRKEVGKTLPHIKTEEARLS